MCCEYGSRLISRNQGPYSQHIKLFVAYKWAPKLKCYITIGGKLARDKRSSLSGQFVCHKVNEVL
jgi:hypothetical protein